MREPERERIMAECVEQYHRRRALGEPAKPEDWCDQLGEHFGEFEEILMAASAIDQLIDPVVSEENFPRPWGSYTLLRILGRGSMGIVYEAIHRDLGRPVALKVLRSGFDDEPLAMERFRREARSCAQVQHDHVIDIFEAGHHDGRPFYAMPLLEGRSLLDLIRAQALPEPAELCRGLADIADALQALHDADIVHRDVKPGNIIVGKDGKMVLSDFGLARTAAAQTLTQTGQALGTPLYMSPEQLLGQREEIDGRTDIYGLGVTMYEAFAGRPPFRSDNVSGLMRMIVAEQPEHLSTAAPGTPVDSANIAMTAMEKGKGDRYQTAAEMRDDLRAFAEGERVIGRPVSPLRRAWRGSRRKFLMVASLLLVAVIAWSLWPEADARLNVVSWPRAMAALDGENVGPTPLLDRPVAPGEHRVVVSKEGWKSEERRFEIRSGDPHNVFVVLIPDDGDSEVVVRDAAGEFGIEYRELGEEPARLRSAAGGPALQVLFPREDVRLADLTRWAVETNDLRKTFTGRIEFRRGDEVLFAEDYPDAKLITEGAIPARVREALAVGDVLTWGFYPVEGRAIVVECRVVEDILADRFAEIDARLAEMPVVLVRHLRALLLLDAGLYTGALLESRRAAEARPDSIRGWAVQKRALEEMGVRSGRLTGDLINGYVAARAAKKSIATGPGNR